MLTIPDPGHISDLNSHDKIISWVIERHTEDPERSLDSPPQTSTQPSLCSIPAIVLPIRTDAFHTRVKTANKSVGNQRATGCTLFKGRLPLQPLPKFNIRRSSARQLGHSPGDREVQCVTYPSCLPLKRSGRMKKQGLPRSVSTVVTPIESNMFSCISPWVSQRPHLLGLRQQSKAMIPTMAWWGAALIFLFLIY